ncbi:MAG: hypothetical protein QOJ21_616 [Solirubrobacteraceae bacterium]|jgi:hypothetical protein|nr:hypothetical protein [Solirubrobacteraceae bacterium]
MPGRRLLLYAVLLLLVATVASAIAPRQRDSVVQTVEPSPAPGGPAADTVDGALPQDRRVRARVGDIVQLQVDHGERDVVEIPTLGISEPVEPGVPALLVFDADREGRFGVRLRMAGTRLGTVDVRPQP